MSGIIKHESKGMLRAILKSMAELLTYTSAEFPESLKWQAVSFLRVQYPLGFVNENRLRDWVIREDEHPIYIVLVERGILISHTNVVWKYLEHDGLIYKAYGLTGVFTYPSFRGHGYGSQVVAAGTEYILQSDADISMLYCDVSLKDFYARHDWSHMDTSISFIGGNENPEPVDDEILMMLFISPKGQRGRQMFESKPIYFGGDYTW
jgi:RimJ/RimL family protein N-acetyltransferase